MVYRNVFKSLHIRWIGAVLAACLSGPAMAEDANPHKLEGLATAEGCDTCHQQPVSPKDPHKPFSLPKMADYKLDGVEMCAGCHDAEDSHKTGMEMDFDPPADLPAGEGNTIICLTCHYVHGPLTGDRPWASVSFMDRLTDHERMHKTYLLRRNNADGELCLTCHDTSKKRL